MERPQVLIIDDETGSRESMALAIEKAGLPVRTFDDARHALDFLEANPGPNLALCDLRMPGMDGIEFLQQVRGRGFDLGVVLITAYGSIESAVEAMRVGADDYLTKPVDLYELRKRVTNLLDNRRLKEEVSTLRQMLDKRYGFEAIIGRSAPMERLFEQMQLVAPTRSTVLIIGDSGTGKELVANALHHASPRRDERFLAINCGAIPSDILESELFGHERGAFTGAVARKIGKFELAHRGTLFLDEISELYPELQVKLLRVLEERRVMRVGGSELIEVDFRLVAATNRDLEKEVAEGRFREDLYYRLKVVTLRIPALRERRADIPLLVEHYLKQICAEHGKEPKVLTNEAMEVLAGDDWPGNVRQLKNAIETLVVFHHGKVVTVDDLPAELRAGGPTARRAAPIQVADGPPRTMEEIERQAILETLSRTGGHRAQAAHLLGIGLRTLQRKLKDYRDQGFWND
ncbi:MAG TPA: sigma-54 dependent transcriptional regulator [Thermoanaerobaculia bacterium]|jgi:two-component system NtrC family response regulator/two-component system response regulator HydG|nr:sigma-54 dependent transcriptional regulator [Thermoanaerobaculia bacterium]